MSDEVFEVKRVFRLPEALAKILLLLLNERYVTAHDIEQRFTIVTDAKVAIHRLRKRLEKEGVEIQSMRSTGYWLDEATKDSLREKLKTPQPETAAA